MGEKDIQKLPPMYGSFLGEKFLKTCAMFESLEGESRGKESSGEGSRGEW